MSYTPISETNVTQTTTNVATRGFGTILCIDEHNQFLERVKSYSSVEECAVDFPTSFKAYQAVVAAFSVDPKPKEIKIGRRLCDYTLTPITAADCSITIKISDTVQSTINISAGGSPTLTSVATALFTAINANATINTTVVATDTVGDVLLSRVGSADFAIVASSNLTLTPVAPASPESVATTFAAIQAETTDFYCVASTNRLQSFVLDMAAVIAATKNVYTYATSDANAYGTFSPSSTDYTATIKIAGNKRVVFPVYVQASEMEKYPEIRIFASKSGYQAGDVIYSNIVNLGILPAKTATNTLLTNSQKSNLADRGLSYFESKNGVTVLRRGMAQGTGATSWADETIGADFIEARINEQVMTLFTNQYSEKIGGSAAGYARIESVIRTVLDSMKTTATAARLLRKYTVTIPTEDEITSSIRAGRVATIKVAAYLEGALDSAVVNVTLTY